MDTVGPVLIVSAHAADFVWRAGGYIALAARGPGAHVVCLSYGERGESAALWKAGATLAEVKAARRSEAAAAAKVLGAEITFLDAGDYPLPRDSAELMDALVQKIRTVSPSAMLVHSAADPYNADHPRAAELALEARILAQAAGYPSDHPTIGAPPVFRFEPHQPEMCDFMPDVLVDITEVFALKRKAMECMAAQEHLWAYYTDLAVRRGIQAIRNGGPKTIRHAEAYQRIYPQVTEVLT